MARLKQMTIYMHMHEAENVAITSVLARLVLAAALGGLMGYSSHRSHRAIAMSAIALVAAGSAGFMLLAKHLALTDPSTLSRALQTSVLVISLLAVGIVWGCGIGRQGIRMVATLWVAGAVGLTIATQLWWLGVILAITTMLILAVAERVRFEQE